MYARVYDHLISVWFCVWLIIYGSVTAQVHDAKQSKQLLSSLDDLPIELLVYIFSLLPTSRDIVRLRYVSRKMRSVSETSSLWRNFL